MIFIVASEVKARCTSRACYMIHYLYMNILFPKPLNTNTRGSFLPFHTSYLAHHHHSLQQGSDETDGHQQTTDLVGASSTGVCDGAVLGWVGGVASWGAGAVWLGWGSSADWVGWCGCAGSHGVDGGDDGWHAGGLVDGGQDWRNSRAAGLVWSRGRSWWRDRVGWWAAGLVWGWGDRAAGGDWAVGRAGEDLGGLLADWAVGDRRGAGGDGILVGDVDG